MPDFKASLIFNAGRRGWTETWYGSFPSLSDGLAKMGPLAKARAALIGYGVAIEAARVSDIANPNVAQLIAGPDFTVGGPAPVKLTFPIADQAGAAILATVVSTGGQKRQMWLRGCPDVWIERNSENPNTFKFDAATLTKAWKVWRDFLAGDGLFLRLRVINKAAGASPVHQITAVTINVTTDRYVFTTAAAHGFAVNDKVNVRKAKGLNLSNALGLSTVVAVPTPTSFETNRYTRPGWNTVYEGSGNVRKQVYEFVGIQGAAIVRVAMRKTGRALFVPRGRRSVRV